MPIPIPPSAGTTRRRASQRGIALVTALVTLMLTVLVGSLLLQDSRRQAIAASNQVSLTKAQFAAERAVGEAVDRLVGRASPPIDTSNPGNTGTVGSGQWPPAGVAADHGYSYTVAPRLLNGAPVLDEAGRPLYQVSAEGTSGAARRQVRAMLALTRSPGIWGNSIIGCHGVTLNSSGGVTSYKAGQTGRSGAAVRTLSNLGSTPANIELLSATTVGGPLRAVGNLILDSSAKLVGDGFANGNIQVKSSATLEGNAFAGGSISTDKSTGVTGTRNPGQSPAPVETEACDPLGVDDLFAANAVPIATSNDNAQYNMNASVNNVVWGADNQTTRLYFANNTTISDRNRTFRGDVTLYAKQNFTLGGTTRFILAPGAKLTLYVEGRFYVDSNAVINWPTTSSSTGYGSPQNVAIYSRYADSARRTAADLAGFGMNSNSKLSAIVYAPRTHTYFDSNALVSGALRGKWVNFNSNVRLAYDEGLKDIGGGEPTGYRLAFWADVPFSDYAP